jgi:methylmalonyl-CoA mutase N-terminal domain/subunit
LTNEIEEEAVKYIEKIDNMGGAVRAIEKGYMQREIVESAYQHQKEVESKQKAIVGLNQFRTEEETPIRILRVNPEVEKNQIKKLQVLKRKRSQKKVAVALDQLRKAAEANVNLMPFMVEAVKEYATLGEICNVLREIYGEHKASTVF